MIAKKKKTVSKKLPKIIKKKFRNGNDATPTVTTPFIQITVPPHLPLYIFNSLPAPAKTVARLLYNSKRYINYDKLP